MAGWDTGITPAVTQWFRDNAMIMKVRPQPARPIAAYKGGKFRFSSWSRMHRK